MLLTWTLQAQFGVRSHDPFKEPTQKFWILWNRNSFTSSEVTPTMEKVNISWSSRMHLRPIKTRLQGMCQECYVTFGTKNSNPIHTEDLFSDVDLPSYWKMRRTNRKVDQIRGRPINQIEYTLDFRRGIATPQTKISSFFLMFPLTFILFVSW